MLASRLSGCQGAGAGEELEELHFHPQIVGYHMPISFYQRLWKVTGPGAGKEKGRKGRRGKGEFASICEFPCFQQQYLLLGFF